MKAINKINWLMVLLASLIIGCGASKDAQKENEIFWPEPPDEPRLKYIKTYQSEEDFASKLQKFSETFTGKTGFRLNRPFAVTSNDSGKIFVTDVEGGIFLFDEIKKNVTVLGEYSSVSLENPRGIDFGNGKLFVGLIDYGAIAVVSPDGKFIKFIGKSGGLGNPVGVIYDEKFKRIIAVDYEKHNVVVFSEEGDSLFTIGERGEKDGQFNYPQSGTVDSAGNIYVVDGFNFRIQQFDPQGNFIRKFGTQGNLFGMFARPKGIALDIFQNIYVVDAIHNNFQIFNQELELLLFVGKFAIDDNRGFSNPIGIHIDKNNQIYICDQLNQRLQIFKLLENK